MRSTRKNGEASDRLHQRQMRTVGSCLVVTLPYLLPDQKRLRAMAVSPAGLAMRNLPGRRRHHGHDIDTLLLLCRPLQIACSPLVRFQGKR
jgi:hypothetical protein